MVSLKIPIFQYAVMPKAGRRKLAVGCGLWALGCGL